MSNSIMMRMKPEAVQAIASGRSTAELKLTFPHFLHTPFKVYIFENRGNYVNQPNIGYTVYRHEGRGMVVGEAICHDIQEFSDSNGYEQAAACGMTIREVSKILDGNPGYVFHFENIKMYDNPKSIEEFGSKRPPQSWFHVREVKQ